MRPRFDLRHVACFLAIVEHGSFRGAARHLNIAQPALSRTLRNLEEALGALLIARDRRGLELTPAGRVFAAGGARLLDEAADLAHSASRAHKGLLGQLRVSYTDFAIAGALPDIVNAFRTAFPEISVTFTPSVTTSQIEALREGRIDAGFLTGPVELPFLQTHMVQRDDIVAVLPAGHRLAARERVTLGDLADEAFVLGVSERWSHFLTHVTHLCQGAGFLPKLAQEAADSEAILGLVAAGIGVTLSIESIAKRPRPGIVMRRLVGQPYEVQTLLAWRRGGEDPALQHFRDIALIYWAEVAAVTADGGRPAAE
ncbi:LysR family transcriptional regulator [Algihabitans albus]|uniref:LysR family transcriptional regulator n=1 Tax=Algihabitans albus TaxID=2164067 RepID=UPI000E5C7FBF|nr:LysR family transcriptional regulator [Algihabitans albus]